MSKCTFLSLLLLFLLSCSSTDNSTIDTTPADASLYFPPISDGIWETVSPSSLDWNEEALTDLKTFVRESKTKAFVILKNGRIVVEEYYGDTTLASKLPWYSAAKTLTASVVGIAQDQQFLNVTDKTSTYLGEGWTTMSLPEEKAITIKNQLSMTSGGDYNIPNLNCTTPDCLTYLSDAGTSWYYHNAFYLLLQDVISQATPSSFEDYFYTQLQDKIGMSGSWLKLGFANVYRSNARSMARFGLLQLNNGIWKDEKIIPEAYFGAMTSTSQPLNNAYGYLWWLNGKENYKLPGTTSTFSGKLIPTAPDDLFAGLGLDDQKVYIVPSEKLVVIRLGDASGDATLGPSGYDTELWSKIMEVIRN